MQHNGKLAIWDTPPAAFMASGLTSGAATVPFDLKRASARDCEEMLRAGAVDVALLPASRALQHPDDYDVLSAVALSSWAYPFARLVLKNGLRGPTRQVACHPDHAQEALVARIILKEHYDLEPPLVAREQSPRSLLREAEEEAVLLVGNDVPTMNTEHLTLDLGREWYELANYPMVWGLLATRKEENDPDMIRDLRTVAEASEEQRDVWVQAQEMPAELHDFFADALRLRLDKLAIASLTELRHYLFYYDLTDEVPDVPFVYIPDDEEAGGDEDEILL